MHLEKPKRLIIWDGGSSKLENSGAYTCTVIPVFRDDAIQMCCQFSLVLLPPLN